MDEFIGFFAKRGGCLDATVSSKSRQAACLTPLLMLFHRHLRPEPDHEDAVRELAHSLLRAGANPKVSMANEKGLCPLAQAVIYGRLPLAKLPLEYGADPDQKDANGCTVAEVITKHKRAPGDGHVVLLEEAAGD